jgi:hypothetical protein
MNTSNFLGRLAVDHTSPGKGFDKGIPEGLAKAFSNTAADQ